MAQSCKQTPRPRDGTCIRELAAFLSPRLFRALSDPTRLAILVRLAGGGGEMTVSEVARCCPVDLSVVSRHLAVLREAGVVSAARRGKEVFYSIRFGELAGSLRAIADALEACCPPGGGDDTPGGDS